MKQGVLTSQRVRILFRDGMSGYRIRKRGERKRKSTRGCIVSSDLSVLNLVVVKKGDAEIEGLTDVQKPRRLGPKRASKIRKLFNLEKGDDVRKYVIRRQVRLDRRTPGAPNPRQAAMQSPNAVASNPRSQRQHAASEQTQDNGAAVARCTARPLPMLTARILCVLCLPLARSSRMARSPCSRPRRSSDWSEHIQTCQMTLPTTAAGFPSPRLSAAAACLVCGRDDILE